MKQRNKLMIPGPVPVWEETLDALSEQVMSNYTDEFIPIFRETMNFLHQVFQTQNDIFVLTNWAKDSKADGKIMMLADGSADFVKKVGLDIDLSGRGMGVRSKRYSMVVDDGVVTVLNVEDAPPSHDKSSAATMLSCKF